MQEWINYCAYDRGKRGFWKNVINFGCAFFFVRQRDGGEVMEIFLLNRMRDE